MASAAGVYGRPREAQWDRQQIDTRQFLALCRPQQALPAPDSFRQAHRPDVRLNADYTAVPLFSPLNGHPLTRRLYFSENSGITGQNSIVHPLVFVTIAPSNLPTVKLLFPDWIQNIIAQAPQHLVTAHHSALSITPQTSTLRMTMADLPADTSTEFGVSGDASSLPRIHPDNIPCDGQLHLFPDEGCVQFSFPDENGFNGPCGLWVMIRRALHFEVIYVSMLPNDQYLPLVFENLHTYTESLKQLQTQQQTHVRPNEAQLREVLGAMTPEEQDSVYWSIWKNDGRPTGNPNYGQDAFQADPNKALAPLQAMRYDLRLLETSLVFAENVPPHLPLEETSFRIMECAFRILLNDCPNGPARLICDTLPTNAQRLIDSALRLRSPWFKRSADVAQAITNFTGTHDPEALVNALLFAASCPLPSHDASSQAASRPPLPSHHGAPLQPDLVLWLFENFPLLSGLSSQDRATKVNALLQQHLDEQTRNQLYGQVWARSEDTTRGGPNWGENHVADNLHLLVDLIIEFLGTRTNA